LNELPAYASVLAGVDCTEQRYHVMRCSAEQLSVVFDRWTHETKVLADGDAVLASPGQSLSDLP
jgi:hypothetical protein